MTQNKMSIKELCEPNPTQHQTITEKNKVIQPTQTISVNEIQEAVPVYLPNLSVIQPQWQQAFEWLKFSFQVRQGRKRVVKPL